MSKKRRDPKTDAARPEDVRAAGSAPAVRPLVPVLLIATAAAESLLALYQWMELLVLRAGGTVACGISETVDCQRVWDSPFAAAVHKVLGMPVAALGLVWGLTALGVSLAWTHRLLTRREDASPGAAVKLVALAGIGSVVVWAIGSFQAGALCLTCLGTYAIVAGFALVALRMIPGPLLPAGGPALRNAALWSAGFAVGAYLVLLGPGRATPSAGASGAELLERLEPSKVSATRPPSNPDSAGAIDAGAVLPAAGVSRPMTEADRAVLSLFGDLPLAEKQGVSNALALYRAARDPGGEVPAPRRLYGPKDAPVRIVEWVDVRCGHCRHLNDLLNELKRVVPEGSISVEARNFPLAAECNPHVQRPDPSNVSCTAAKAMICLEGSEDYWTVRDQLFAAQQALDSKERVLTIASSGSMKRAALEKCIDSPETAEKLAEDLRYAMKYNPMGTPVFVLNGKEARWNSAPFLYAMALTGGDEASPAFESLPPPNLVSHDPHAGHDH